MKTKRATISDVAEKAGVSTTAVSFAFNNPDQIAEETAVRIHAVAEELGYSPNPIARAMHSSSTGVIGLLVPMSLIESWESPFIYQFMKGIVKVCDKYALGVLTVSPYENSVLKASQRAPVDGFIVLGLDEVHWEIEPLRRRRIPFVIVDGESISTSEVNIDDEQGAHLSANFLLERGHTNIMIMTFEKPVPYHADNVLYGVGGRRIRGIQRAFAEHDLPFSFDLTVQSATSVEGGYQSFLAAWQAGFHPSAVIALSDAMAIGAMKASMELGLRIPEDLEVIGFDDIEMASTCNPPLTTVHQPIEEKGRIAAQLLVDALQGKTIVERVLLQSSLVIRGSTRS
jgi:alanine racemase